MQSELNSNLDMYTEEKSVRVVFDDNILVGKEENEMRSDTNENKRTNEDRSKQVVKLNEIYNNCKVTIKTTLIAVESYENNPDMTEQGINVEDVQINIEGNQFYANKKSKERQLLNKREEIMIDKTDHDDNKFDDLVKEFNIKHDQTDHVKPSEITLNNTINKEIIEEDNILKEFDIEIDDKSDSTLQTYHTLTTCNINVENENMLGRFIEKFNNDKESNTTTNVETNEENNYQIDGKTNQRERAENKARLGELIKEFNIDTDSIDNTMTNNNTITDKTSKLNAPISCANFNKSDSSGLLNTDVNSYKMVNAETVITISSSEDEQGKDYNALENMLDLDDFNANSDTEAPFDCFDYNFNAEKNEYEMAQELLSNDNERPMKTQKRSLNEHIIEVQNSFLSSDNNKVPSIKSEPKPKNCTKKRGNRRNNIRKPDHNKIQKPHIKKLNKSIQVSEDAIEEIIMEVQTEELRKGNDDEKPVMWPLPSLEDSQLNLPSPEARFHCGDCDKRFATEYDIAVHECSQLYAADFAAYKKTLKKKMKKRKLSDLDQYKSGVDVSVPKPIKRKPTVPRKGIDIGPYTCHVCKRLISRRSGLAVHMRRHYNDLPFECEYCKRKFAVLCDLDRHTVNIHLQNKRYRLKCEVCTKPFYSKDGLLLHKRKKHLGFASYVCDICQKPFDQEYILWRHKKTQHEDGNEIKQSNAIAQYLEILEDAENTKKGKSGSAQTEPEQFDVEMNSIMTQVDDSDIDKDSIEMTGINPLDIELAEFNATDALNISIDNPDSEYKKPSSNNVEVELIDLKQTLLDDSIGLTEVDETKNTNNNENDLELVDVNESILRNIFHLETNIVNDVTTSNENNIVEVNEVNGSLQYYNPSIPIDLGSTGVGLCQMNFSNVGIETNAVGTAGVKLAEDAEESRVLDESIALMETDPNMNAPSTSTGIIAQPNQLNTVQLVQFQPTYTPYFMNGAIRFVNPLSPLQYQNPAVQLVTLSQPNVLLWRF